jgi:glycosyltransferase involved in cell wall biosynthesis
LIYTKFFQKVAAISPGVVECLRKGGVPDSRIALIPEAADPVRITPRAERAEIRAALKVGPDDILILGLGALIHRKGFDVLLEALKRMGADSDPTLQVRIAGAGPELDRLESQAEGLGLARRVRFLGRREDVGDLLFASDVFVLPSRREGLGVASLEAQAAGRPVVASAVGGLLYSVEDGATGFLVPPEDAASLAEALRKVVGDADIRRALGASALDRARREFSPGRMVEDYHRLYQDVLDVDVPTTRG